MNDEMNNGQPLPGTDPPLDGPAFSTPEGLKVSLSTELRGCLSELFQNAPNDRIVLPLPANRGNEANVFFRAVVVLFYRHCRHKRMDEYTHEALAANIFLFLAANGFHFQNKNQAEAEKTIVNRLKEGNRKRLTKVNRKQIKSDSIDVDSPSSSLEGAVDAVVQVNNDNLQPTHANAYVYQNMGHTPLVNVSSFAHTYSNRVPNGNAPTQNSGATLRGFNNFQHVHQNVEHTPLGNEIPFAQTNSYHFPQGTASTQNSGTALGGYIPFPQGTASTQNRDNAPGCFNLLPEKLDAGTVGSHFHHGIPSTQNRDNTLGGLNPLPEKLDAGTVGSHFHHGIPSTQNRDNTLGGLNPLPEKLDAGTVGSRFPQGTTSTQSRDNTLGVSNPFAEESTEMCRQDNNNAESLDEDLGSFDVGSMSVTTARTSLPDGFMEIARQIDRIDLGTRNNPRHGNVGTVPGNVDVAGIDQPPLLTANTADDVVRELKAIMGRFSEGRANTSAASHGLVSPIVSKMQQFRYDAKVQMEALLVIAEFAQDDENRAVFGRTAGCISHIINYMQLNREYPKVLELAACALARLAKDNEENQIIIIKFQGITTIVDAAETFPQEKLVQSHTLWALHELTCCTHSAMKEAALEELVRRNPPIVDVLIQAWEHFSDNVEITVVILITFCSLMTPAGTPTFFVDEILAETPTKIQKEICSSFLNGRGVEMLEALSGRNTESLEDAVRHMKYERSVRETQEIFLLHAHQNAPRLPLAALQRRPFALAVSLCVLLLRLSMGIGVEEQYRIGELGIKALLTTMTNFEHRELVQEIGMAVIVKLCSSKRNVRFMTKLDAVRTVQKAVQIHSRSDKIYHFACGFVSLYFVMVHKDTTLRLNRNPREFIEYLGNDPLHNVVYIPYTMLSNARQFLEKLEREGRINKSSRSTSEGSATLADYDTDTYRNKITFINTPPPTSFLGPRMKHLAQTVVQYFS